MKKTEPVPLDFVIDKFYPNIKTMRHIKEPKGVDFIIESKPLTEEERKKISESIRKDKARLADRKKPSITNKT